MLSLNNIFKNYGSIQVLNNISLNISKDESVALIGPNSSGKTTLIKSIVGLVKPEKGDILFNGKNTNSEYSYRKDIGYMPQIGRYPVNLTPAEIIEFIKNLRNFTENSIIDNLAEEFELIPHLKKKMNTLSGGTKQKVSAILTFMFNPEFYLLDEPTAGLDPLMSVKFKNIIKERNKQGKTVVIVSHLISEIEELAERIIYLIDGKIIIDEKKEQIIKKTGENSLDKAIIKYLKEQS